MQTVLNILTIIAFCLSTYTFIKDLVQKRKNIEFKLEQVVYLNEKDTYRYIFSFQILNKSWNPIAISNLALKNASGIYDFYSRPMILFNAKNKQSPEFDRKINGTVFPVNISSLGAERIYLSSYNEDFPLVESNDEIEIIAYTNRGKIEKKVTIPHLECPLELSPGSLPKRK